MGWTAARRRLDRVVGGTTAPDRTGGTDRHLSRRHGDRRRGVGARARDPGAGRLALVAAGSAATPMEPDSGAPANLSRGRPRAEILHRRPVRRRLPVTDRRRHRRADRSRSRRRRTVSTASAGSDCRGLRCRRRPVGAGCGSAAGVSDRLRPPGKRVSVSRPGAIRAVGVGDAHRMLDRRPRRYPPPDSGRACADRRRHPGRRGSRCGRTLSGLRWRGSVEHPRSRRGITQRRGPHRRGHRGDRRRRLVRRPAAFTEPAHRRCGVGARRPRRRNGCGRSGDPRRPPRPTLAAHLPTRDRLLRQRRHPGTDSRSD